MRSNPRGDIVGEIRVKVILTNAIDVALHKRRKLAKNHIRQHIGEAVVDPRAMYSVIPQHVLHKLGLAIRTNRVTSYADGRTESLGVSEGIIFDIDGRDTLEEAFVLGNEVLIGQTVLEKMDLLADCKNQRLMPHPARPDQPVSMIRRRH